MKMIDLSVPIEESLSELIPLSVNRIGHDESAEAMENVFDCTKTDLPRGLGWAADDVKMNTHSGTYVDVPWHYFPTSEGKQARTIDELPLEWFYSDGVVLDLRHKERGAVVTVEDLRQARRKISYKIKPWDIVLIQTGADRFWGSSEYLRYRLWNGKRIN